MISSTPYKRLSQETIDTLRKLVYDGIQYHVTSGYSNCFIVNISEGSLMNQGYLMVRLRYIHPPYSDYEKRALGHVQANVTTYGKRTVENKLEAWILDEILVTDRYRIREDFIDAGLCKVMVTLHENGAVVPYEHILTLVTKHTN